MAVILTHTPPLRKAGRTMLLAVAGFGAATIVFGLSNNFWLSMAMLALTGALDNISVVVRHTMVQLATPNEMRGRVSAVNAMFISSSNELGGFESGAVAHFFGPVISVVSGGIGTIDDRPGLGGPVPGPPEGRPIGGRALAQVTQLGQIRRDLWPRVVRLAGVFGRGERREQPKRGCSGNRLGLHVGRAVSFWGRRHGEPCSSSG